MQPAHTYSNILVSTDFSANSVLGLDWAIEIAGHHGAAIHLLHVLPSDLWLTVEDEIVRRLEELESRCAHRGITASSGLKVGPVAPTITAEATHHDADLVVVGARGHSGMKRFVLGSTAEKIVRSATRPVMVVHPNHEIRPDAFESVLITTDFSETSRLAAQAALALARKMSMARTTTILHVWMPMMLYGVPVYPPDTSKESAEVQLNALADNLAAPDDHVEKVIVEDDHPVNAILSHAEEQQYGLIVMGTQDKGVVDRLLIGSTADRVLRHAPCPVFLYRGEEK